LAYETGNGDKTSSIKDVLNYMLSDGSQDKAPSLGFIPLKGDILKASRAAVNKISE
jgi:phosphate transport system substrate-binding protein